ncbi:MAG: L,D-transpeptidase family protein, partial [Pseudomonadota bacterium]
KTADAKTADTKTADAKTANSKTADSKSADAKAYDAKTSDTKSEPEDAGAVADGKPGASQEPEDVADVSATPAKEESPDAKASDKKDVADAGDPAKAPDKRAADNKAPDKEAKSADATDGLASPSDAKSEASDADAAAKRSADAPPPVPAEKPADVRAANAKTAKPADKAEAATGKKTATGTKSGDDAKSADTASASSEIDPSELTGSIDPAPAQTRSASGTATDEVEVASLSEGAPQPDAATPHARAYDDTVVLDISPPPGTEEPQSGDTKLASLDPAEDAQTDDAIDLGPPPPPPVDPVIAAVRSSLEGPSAPKINASDLEALKTIYNARDDNPLWVTDGALNPKAKALIATVGDADDWGLVSAEYKVPAPGSALDTAEAEADAELALSAAVLKYARHAQTGRLTPTKVNKLFDYHPKARDPEKVLIEIAKSKAPDKKLLLLHPQNAQYQKLHGALVQARDNAARHGGNPINDRQVQLIVMNMERWRWLPSDLGALHVWNNIPEAKVGVIKNGREIYREKTIVGQPKYATYFFSAPMRNIVFNPNWTVPPTIVKEDIAPKLKGPRRPGGLFSGPESRNRMLRRYGLTANYKGKPINADTVDWKTVNVHAYTFTQAPGPHNVLGQFKFNFPNKHAIYMHDTSQRELFSNSDRTLSHGCIRVNDPARFAALVLGEDKGWTMRNVQDVFARAQGETKVIALKQKIPVHMTYNTIVADGYGSVREARDVYGLDRGMAAKLFKNPAYFSGQVSSGVVETAPSTDFAAPARRYSDRYPSRRRSANSVDNFLSGILGN